MSDRTTRRSVLGAFALIGLASGAWAADPAPAPTGPDLRSVRALIKAKNYTGALTELRALEPKNPVADVYNLMGFSLRKSGDRAQAMTYYKKALALEPGHRGALEYQGQLFVEIGQIDDAKQNLAKLQKMCAFGCEEEADLRQAIAAATKKP